MRRNMPPQLEVAVFSPTAALLAQSIGAARVELNASSSYPAGGLTPPVSTVTALSAQLTIPLRLMIRPRGPPHDGSHDFIYNDDELSSMRREISILKGSGTLVSERGDGFVFGILEAADGNGVKVDVERCSELVELARPFPCFFHRAFDPIVAANGWEQGLRDLATCGFGGLLTSGGKGNFDDNVDDLLRLARKCAPLELTVGGGLRANKLDETTTVLLKTNHSLWLHTASLSKNEDGITMETLDTTELRALLDAIASTGEANTELQVARPSTD